MSAHAYTAADVERIAQRLGGAGKNGSGWDCRCPAHEDGKASLSLSIGKGGKLLWHCHAGCEQSAVLEGLKQANVLMNGDARPAEHKPQQRRRIVATYSYVDEHGAVLFEVVRYQPKDFRQRRPDGNGSYIWSLGDTRRVLYRLPEVLAAREVLFVEGEKDADQLRSLGFVTTTSPQGAKFWRDELAVPLAGKRVAVIPDNDNGGRDHAQVVAAAARKHGATSVKLLELGVQKKGGDASDWLAAGHTADELRDLIAKAPEWKPSAEGNPGWQSSLLWGDNGPLANEHNVLIALRHAPELAGRVRFNELSHAAECTALPWRQGEDWRPWTDNDDTALAAWLQGCGVNIGANRVAAAVQLAATDRPHHPIRAYLDGLKWDGTQRLDTWLATYLGVAFEDEDVEDDGQKKAAKAKNTYLREVGRKSLIQPVARIYQPGCKADHVLISEGPQGAGKSSAVAGLSPDPAWFCDEIADLGSKDAAQDLAGKWIIEMPELSAMKRSEVERNKAFISRRVDHYRPSYGRRSQDFPRQCVFFGTTNADAYLSDETGNRRFWGVKVGKIALEKLQRDRDQLWAEAVAAYKAGEKWWLDADTEKVAADAQAERRIGDAWEDVVLEWADRQALSFTVCDVLSKALQVPCERQDQNAFNRVARLLKANGWERFNAREGRRRQWRYRRPAVGPGTTPDPAPDASGTTSGTESGADEQPRERAASGTNAPKGASSGTTGTGKKAGFSGCGSSGSSGSSDFSSAHVKEGGGNEEREPRSPPRHQLEPWNHWNQADEETSLDPLDDEAELTMRGEALP